MSAISEEERHRVLFDWNDTEVAVGVPASLPALFEEVARARPDAIAVQHAHGRVTYSQLDLRANRLARHLTALGVRHEDRVALCVERGLDSIVAVLAILKAGGAYVPIDEQYPAERIAFMLQDAGVTAVVTQASLRGRFPDRRLVVLDEALEAISRYPADAPPVTGGPDSLAYVMYTSGSTGKPKGVEVVHRAIDRLVRGVSYVRLGPEEVMLHAAPLAFDASTFELWGALLLGGRLVVHAEPLPTARGLRDSIRRSGVTTAWLTAALFNTIVDLDVSSLEGLQQLIIGGEALSVPHVRRALEQLPDTRIINGYGPTETTTFACCYSIPRPLPAGMRSIPIGRPIRNTRVYILDETRAPVPIGEPGEIYIGGDGVARGYLARPELTRERFVDSPFRTGERLYRTGDLARYLSDGRIEFIGRSDGQVKIRGYRIEPGEVEAGVATLPGIRHAVVVAREDTPGDKRLVAYVVAAGDRSPTSVLRQALGAKLPAFMVPSAFVWLDAIPLTANGKLDTRALPAPTSSRPDLANAFQGPANERERALCDIWSDALGIAPVGSTDNVFDLAATSLLAVRVAARIQAELGLDVSAVSIFEHPTVRELAQSLDRRDPARELAARVARYARTTGGSHGPIAIVGMAARYPGARNVDELWELLRDGRETVRFFADEELDASIPASQRAGAYVRARGILDGADLFDAAFFGISPREAEVMDPQQRVLLELAWESLEDAGHVPESFPGRIGVFAGKYNDTYWSENVVTRPDLVAALGAFQAMIANEKDYVATRLAHKLDLTGPALSIHTACSTSLVAIAQAVRSLRGGECDMALAGGVSITVPIKSGYTYQEGGMLSNDGHTRSFDVDAQGTVFSDGAGIVVLRRLADALHDGDTIHAVIRGVAINNDGASKASFTAPSIDGQAVVVAMAQADARVDARSISFLEAHGTATPLGDPIEVEALSRAFRAHTPDTGFCALGSIKSNFGHAVIAAGVAGVIKTALSLVRGVIPPTVHFRAPNPKVDLASSPFFVNAVALPWPRGAEPRRAGVSSFGVGGTNAHVVLEEAPAREEKGTGGRQREVLLLSGRSLAALDAATRALGQRLEERPDLSLADVAFTLHAGRGRFRHRRAVIAGDCRGAAAALQGRAESLPTRSTDSHPPSVVFMFPGQGAQYVGMGRSLYREEPSFRDDIDRCAEHLSGALGRDLRSIMFPDRGDIALADATLRETRYTQPALFSLGFSLARLWQSWGVLPSAMVGHSVGELVCAVLAGVMSLEDALHLVGARGQLMFQCPPGDMLSIRAPAKDIAAQLGPGLAVASDNGPSVCVAAGPHEAIEELRARLEARGVVCKPLHTSHAFHSEMMDPVIEPFSKLVGKVELSAPRIPFVSTLTGTWITPEQARDPRYWGRHLRETVRFTEAVATLWKEPNTLLLEVGPRGTLSTLARQQVTDKARQVAVASLGDSEDAEWDALLSAYGRLWCCGVDADAAAFWQGRGGGRRISLPTYPFERQRYWIEPVRATGAVPVGANGMLERAKEESAIVSVASGQQLTSVVTDLRQVFEDASGIEIGEADLDTNFVELGLDSLFLTQVALAVQRKTGVKVTFRQLVEELPTVRALAEHIAERLPPAPMPAPPRSSPESSGAAPVGADGPSLVGGSRAAPETIQWLIEQQLQLMTKQLAALQGVLPSLPSPALQAVETSPTPPLKPSSDAAKLPNLRTTGSEESDAAKKPFGAIARISLRADELSPRQRARLDALTRRYTTRTKASKHWTQEHRRVMADPRVATGFRPAIKELVYPIVVQRSLGARLWDLDGNEYIDTLMGFGCNLFGWQPAFVTRAIQAQLESGHEIGPQTTLAGDCARILCEMTGFDRAAFCNTGSEAVMGTMRIARTVTGRSRIALFSGSYHGIFDEVIVRGTKKLKAIPAAPGIMASAAENVLVLDYGTPESLEILRSQADTLAAVLVEPVQSRRPDFQPREFLHGLRELTLASGTVLVFDEVITGFRTCPGGAQEHFGVRADLASYGKVIGGGLPIGVIAGKRAFMDALDGGDWQFGDASVPTVGVTYFAGTFVRHPLALAALKAVLLHLKEQGPELQRETNAKTERLARELNAFFKQADAPLEIRHFGSLWKTFFTVDQPWGDLLFVMLRDRGIHIMDGFPCFFTTAHSSSDVDTLVRAFKSAVTEMQESGFLPEPASARAGPPDLDANVPPVEGARLGRDADGNPAWFVPNPGQPGKYVKVERPS